MVKINNKPKKKGQLGLPFKRQLIGGYRNSDVLSYFNEVALNVARDRMELEDGKKELYKLLEKGQRISDDLVLRAEKEAAEVIAKAQKSADEMVCEAKRRVEELESERTRIMERYQADITQLHAALIAQHSEFDRNFRKLVQPIEASLVSLGRERNEP